MTSAPLKQNQWDENTPGCSTHHKDDVWITTLPHQDQEVPQQEDAISSSTELKPKPLPMVRHAIKLKRHLKKQGPLHM